MILQTLRQQPDGCPKVFNAKNAACDDRVLVIPSLPRVFALLVVAASQHRRGRELGIVRRRD